MAKNTEENIDFDQCIVDINLQQNGVKTTIYSGPLGLAHEESNWLGLKWNYVRTLTRDSHVLLAHGAANKPINLIPLYIDFGTVINLDGDDYLTVDVRTETTMMPASSVADPATSYVVVDGLEGIGLQYITPKITVETIQAAEGTWKRNLGDNVMSCIFINKDKNTVLTADSVISIAALTSDRLNYSDSKLRLIQKRAAMFPNITDSDARGNSFMLIGQEVDKALLSLTLTSANVTAAKNFVVYRSFETNAATVRKAEGKSQKHIRKAVSKIY